LILCVSGQHLEIIASILIAAFLASLITTPYGRKIGVWLNMVDQPGTRKIHRYAAVRSGGIAVAFGLIAGYVLAFLLAPADEYWVWWREAMILGSVLVASIGGFRDDVSPIGARTRVLMQIAAGGLFLLSIAGEISAYSEVTEVPALLIYPACLLLLVTVINAVNFIDGIDGLSTTLVTLSVVAIAVSNANSHVGIEYGALAVAGAAGGFLPWNLLGYKRGRVFLGDGGATLLGALLAMLAIRTVLVQNTTAPIGVAQVQDFLLFVGLVGIPIMDEGAIVLRRLLTGWPLARGDQSHIHHLAMIHASRTRKPDRVALIVIGLVHLIVISAAVCAHAFVEYRWQIAGFGAALPLLVYARFGYFEPGVFKRGKIALKEVLKAPRNPITKIQALRVVVSLQRFARIMQYDYIRLSGEAGPIFVIHGEPGTAPPTDARLYRFAMTPRGLSVIIWLEVYVKRRFLVTRSMRVALMGPLLAPLQRALGALPQNQEDRGTTQRRLPVGAPKDHEDEKRTAPIFTGDRLPE